MNEFDKKYEATLDWIYSWIDFSMKRHVDDTHRFFKLDRMNHMMDLLNHPERAYPVIHVAGTKGKGSTASFIAAALQASGFRVGLYTSPHLEDFRERVRVNGEMISRETLVDLADDLRPCTAIVTDVTTFELTTAIAFLYFQQAEVDIAVLEVGLGGRLDATNVVDPLLSVITSISYDHMAVLGDTLTEIAYEKGGIIKPGRPVVIAPQQDEARRELLRIANERGAPVTFVEKDYQFSERSHTLNSQKITIRRVREDGKKSSAQTPLDLTIPLLGAHQVANAATALAALDVARQAGWRITRAAIQRGFSQVSWPARFEILRKMPPLVVDSAHNGDSMVKLRDTLNEYFGDLPFIMIFGSSADKEMDAMLTAILPRVELVIASQSIHPRAKDANELKDIVAPYGVPVIAAAPAEAALAKALELAGKDKGIIVTGSMFIAAAIRVIWNEKSYQQFMQ